MGSLRDKLFKGGVLTHVRHVEDHLSEIKCWVLTINLPCDDPEEYLVYSFNLNDEWEFLRHLGTMVPC